MASGIHSALRAVETIALVLVATPAQKRYGPGVTDTEIRSEQLRAVRRCDLG
jgi:hypothetical protein